MERDDFIAAQARPDAWIGRGPPTRRRRPLSAPAAWLVALAVVALAVLAAIGAGLAFNWWDHHA